MFETKKIIVTRFLVENIGLEAKPISGNEIGHTDTI